LKLFGYIKKGYRILNLDESWVGGTNYLRRAWKSKSVPNSQVSPPVRPRITLILALDNSGRTYMSLLQCNSNESVMQLFMSELVKILENEDKHFRKNTVIVWDGASYHSAKETIKTMAALDLPIM
jgi:hypothetical protein